MDRVVEDHDCTIITRSNRPAAVLMALEDFESWQETAYLLSSPVNAARLLRSIRELDEGRGTARELTGE
jgi:antitoxin YefM